MNESLSKSLDSSTQSPSHQLEGLSTVTSRSLSKQPMQWPDTLRDFDLVGADAQVDLVASLSATLSLDPDTRSALITAMGLRGSDSYVRNQIANLLTRQDDSIEDLIPGLIISIQDAQEVPLWRDYALQHLGGITPRINQADVAEAAKATILSCFHGNVEGLPGTALLALLDWQSTGFRDFTDEDCARVYFLAQSGTVGRESRITAIATLSDVRLTDGHTCLRRLLEGETDPILLVAAAAGLGRCGNIDDTSALARLIRHGDDHVRNAALAATDRLANQASIIEKSLSHSFEVSP